MTDTGFDMTDAEFNDKYIEDLERDLDRLKSLFEKIEGFKNKGVTLTFDESIKLWKIYDGIGLISSDSNLKKLLDKVER